MDLKKHFPFFDASSSLVYLDNAATTHKPHAVIEAINNFYQSGNANVHRGVYRLAEQATEQYEIARATMARFINARPHEFVFVPGGTTFALNCIAHAWALHHLKKGDRIVLTELEHHANILPWHTVAHHTGAIIDYIPVDQQGNIDITHLDSIISKNTKFVSFCLVSHAYSTIIPYQHIITRAKQVGARICVDAAQAMAHHKIDVKQLDIDFLAFSGHKMFGPTGIGGLYIHERIHDQIDPFLRGGGMVLQTDFYKSAWQKMPYRLEAGTPPIAQAIGMAAAADFIQHYMPSEAIKNHQNKLFKHVIHAIQSMNRISILGNPEAFGHIISLYIKDIHAHDIAGLFDQHGICVRAGTHCAQPLAQKLNLPAWVRISLAGYNDIQDIDYLITALEAILAIL